MKCKEHRRYNGKTKPEVECLTCWQKYLGKSPTYEDICEEFEKRVRENPTMGTEPGLYEFENISMITDWIRSYKWKMDEERSKK